MGLRLKFNLVLMVVFVLGLGVTGYLSYELLHRNARDDVLRNAGVMMEASLSMRSYTVGQVRPNLAVDPDKFLPQSVPAFGATEIMTLLRKKYPDYAYKEAALNPTNPRNRAVEWETDIVNAFRADPARPEISGMRDTPTGRSLYLARPLQINLDHTGDFGFGAIAHYDHAIRQEYRFVHIVRDHQHGLAVLFPEAHELLL